MIDKSVKVNDINIHYNEYPHDGETIIFLHFGFSSLSMWNGVIPFFKDKYHLLLPDCRGHGRSDKPQDGYHIDEMADDVIHLLNELKIEKAHFIGSSLGAELSVSIAARFPNRVLSLVVEGSAMNNAYGPYGLSDPTEEEKEIEKEKMLERIKSSQKSYDSPKILLKALKDTYEPRGMWNEHIKTMAEYEIYETPEGKYTGTVPLWVSLGYMQHYWSLRFENYYKGIKAPVLFIPGEKEYQNERFQTALNHFRSLLSNSKIAHIKGGMHAYVWLFFPQEGSKAILNFLDNLGKK